MVFEQVPVCFRQFLEVQAWIFPVEGKELVAQRGWEGDLLPLLSPGKHPSGMLLSGAGKKHHHYTFQDKFLSVI